MNSLSEREVRAIQSANASAVPGDVIVVAALPGTGKTTLLQKLAIESTEPTVYLMFNRKPCDDFREWLTSKGLEHVSAYTFHKLAYDAVSETGVVINLMEYPPQEITRLTERGGYKSVAAMLDCHPTVATRWYDKSLAGEWGATIDVVLYWMAHASSLPQLLETPTYKRFVGARRLYVDEAQDCSCAMVEIVKKCTDASVVLAGDTNQDINVFMGSCDPVGNRERFFSGCATFPLTTSWRFHSQIAKAFNLVTRERCVGRPGPPSPAPPRLSTTCILCDTNREIDAVREVLQEMGISSHKRGANDSTDGVEVSTIHKAKGAGFDTVVVMRVRRSRNTVATAVSRARERLYVHSSLARSYGIKEGTHVKKFDSLAFLEKFESF